MSTDQWEFKSCLMHARIPFTERISGPLNVIDFPLSPTEHGGEEIRGEAYFDTHGNLMGLHYRDDGKK